VPPRGVSAGYASGERGTRGATIGSVICNGQGCTGHAATQKDKGMSILQLKETLERHQVSLYLGVVLVAGVIARLIPGTTALEGAMNPALALMLFATFLQVPFSALKAAFTQGRFLAVLLGVNFLLVPLLVALLFRFVPEIPMVQLGVLLVLLTPCIDYVVTFAHLGGADARLLLAATPFLLLVQLGLLPFYLQWFLGGNGEGLVQPGPFVEAFVVLIVLPFVLAMLVQRWAAHRRTGERVFTSLGVLAVPATALVLFVVIAAVLPQLGQAGDVALRVLPLYGAFAVVAPLIGWGTARVCRLDGGASRAVAFSAATRNSLVILPLGLAVPGAVPVLPAVIVTQTLVELVSELIYIRLIPRLGAPNVENANAARTDNPHP
jgi:ACR3 family arsenite transporter